MVIKFASFTTGNVVLDMLCGRDLFSTQVYSAFFPKDLKINCSRIKVSPITQPVRGFQYYVVTCIQRSISYQETNWPK